ncbi:hypothetical protein AVEN_151392-1 [Araneus ventricosus]|uniref:Uncharacterized protein n=1 Tax=Araneus ventricosus TaxID=182803 RepID=A0A4Y2CB25_ARAVE|nr:hypothetical protein AVEN_151392-1 [Araneus ventricosus]
MKQSTEQLSIPQITYAMRMKLKWLNGTVSLVSRRIKSAGTTTASQLLVKLTSRFEATRGLFWGGPRNFQHRSDDEDDTLVGTPSPNFHATPTRGRLATTYDLICNRPHTRQIFSGIGFRT